MFTPIHHHGGDHWIWARKGDAWRKGFFARERQLDLQAA
jgi:hypothetical protein